MSKALTYPRAQTSMRRKETLGYDTDPISYEDLLIAKYLEELRKAPPYTKADVQIEKSPYLQKLAHTHVVPMQLSRPTSSMSGGRGSRPISAKPYATVHGGWSSDYEGKQQQRTLALKSHSTLSDYNGTGDDSELGEHRLAVSKTKGSKPRIDSKFISDPNLWDPASPKEGRKYRPVSAPVYKRPYTCNSRPMSAKSVSYTKKTRSLYRQKMCTVVVTAFKNGSRDTFARVAAPNLKLLLEACTEKLGLNTAARRVFLEDGQEVFDENDLRRDETVFISTGEPFKDAEKRLKKTLEASQKSQWTVSGLICSQEGKKKSSKPKLSKRFRNLLEQSKRRVLVFQNGSGSHSVEIVTDPKKLDDFLAACTSKLELGSYGRTLYDWDGIEVTDLEQAPVLDSCLQTWPTPVLGPLWLSKGEGFSPKGVNDFLTGLINYTKAKLKEAKNYKNQLQLAQNQDTKDQVEVVALLSMSPKEIEDNLTMADKDISAFTNALNHLKQQKDKLQDKAEEEERSGSKFTMKHIQEYEMDHKLVGTKGIRLKVYENGSCDEPTVIYFNLQQASKGASKGAEDQKQLMCRLLDQCSSITSLAYPKKNPAIRPVAKRLFTSNGKEIKSVRELQYDEELWLSFGEPWKDPCTYTLGLQLDKVQAVEMQNSERKAFREQLLAEDMKEEDMLKGGKWEVAQGLPEDVVKTVIGESTSEEQKLSIQNLLASNEISLNNYFLRSKERPKLVLYGEVVFNKKTKKSGESGPPESQIWVLSKNGYIQSKAMPQLVLGMTERRVKTRLRQPGKSQGAEIEGYVVAVQKKDDNDLSQQWKFTSDGYICSEKLPNLVFTYLGARYGDDESQVVNEEPGAPPGERIYIAACSRLNPNRPAKPQRWALKQERIDKLGQWKHTNAQHSEWHKQALSWPTKKDGSLNEAYHWPMEGYLLPNAPSLKNLPSGDGPLRLQVLKNGMKEREKATAVVAPDLTHMKKGSHNQGSQGRNGPNHSGHNHGHGKSAKTGRQSRAMSETADAESIDDCMLHCDPEQTVLKLEFTMFLDRCTSLLDLPFPARRLFDANGLEHFNLCSLRRDQLVTVTCGEPWSDPKLSKAEQQRRYLLANLAADVAQIEEYVSIRNPQGLVLEVEGRLVPGSRLIIGESFHEAKVAASSVRTSRNFLDDDGVDQFLEEKAVVAGSSHQIAHQRAEERLTRLKWPWERLYNCGDDSVDLTEEQIAKMEQQRPKRRGNLVGSATELQKFIFEDGFIATEADRNLVLSIPQEGSGQCASVVLARKNHDDVMQRWILKENGLIQTKQNPNLVLAAAPKIRNPSNGAIASYAGSAVTVQRKKLVQFGRANQRWHFDHSTGFIYAFSTDLHDKEITAANRSNVCTYAVLGKTELDQIGYVVEMPEKVDDDRKILTCSSCARAMRGRYRLKKLTSNVDFACAMGSAKEFGLQQIGSFRCLNGKLDLTTHEAEHTLRHWQNELERLRKETSVRTIAKEISAANIPYTVKVMAYKNGDGMQQRPGEYIIGSSIPGILDQCTSRLQLNQAARRLYTVDGKTILHIDDLIEWARETSVHEERQRILDGRGEDFSAVKQETRGISDEETNNEEEHIIFNGNNSSLRHEFIDDEKDVMIIPNPNAPIETDGSLVEWKIYAAKAGQISLNVLRPTKNLLNFTLVGQTECELVEGELIIDISSNPLQVLRGDLIGFQIKNHGMIPYDVDPSNEDPFLYVTMSGNIEIGTAVTLQKSQDPRSRQYSLQAKIVTAERVKGERHAEDVAPKTMGRKKSAKNRSSKIEPPSVDMILRRPVDVFVSCGENFIKPEKVNLLQEELLQNREQLAGTSYQLGKEKHILRMMQGRRIEEQKPGTFRPTQNPDQPVLVEGSWQEPTSDEVEKHNIVHHLQVHLQAMKANQKPKGVKTSKIDTTGRLYTQPNMKRVLVFPNGEKVELAQYIWGETLPQLLDNSTTRLNLSKPARHLFTMDGKPVTDINEIERDQILCVSPTKKFLQPQESQQLIEIKANWARMCKAYGPNSTDIVVEPPKNKHFHVTQYVPATEAPIDSTDD